MTFFFTPITTASLELRPIMHRLSQLEETMFVTVEMLQVALECLEQKEGGKLLRSGVRSLHSQQIDKTITEFMARIDELLREGQRPAAIKQFREEMHVTWDEANAAISEWSYVPRERKLQLLKLAHWVMLTTTPIPQHDLGS